ncbi:MAG: hypothetical protein J2P16_00615 [Mycobacterium sp.]|nr:hypothetical protein [Mycobacterium sp.]
MNPVEERVRVYNGNPFTIRDMCDGIPYEFPSMKAVVIPAEVAAHLFAFPADEQIAHAYMARRFGWNRPEDLQLEAGDPSGLMPWQRKCKAMRLTVEHYELRRINDPSAPIPAEAAGEAPDQLTLREEVPVQTRTRVGRRRPVAKSRRRRHVRPAAERISPAPPPPTSEVFTEAQAMGPSFLEALPEIDRRNE